MREMRRKIDIRDGGKRKNLIKLILTDFAYREDVTSCKLGFTNDISIECEKNYSKQSANYK